MVPEMASLKRKESEREKEGERERKGTTTPLGLKETREVENTGKRSKKGEKN